MMDRDALERTRAGREALAMLRERFPFDEADPWRSFGIQNSVIAACERTMEYHPAKDWNDSQRKAYMQGRASRDDARAALLTVLDYLGSYGNEIRGQFEKTARDRLKPYPCTNLTGGLLDLLDAMDRTEPEHFTPDEAPHHYQIGPLLFPQPITLAKHKPDPQWTGLAWRLEALFRFAISHPRPTPDFQHPETFGPNRPRKGDTMPEGPECFDLTAAWLRASIDPEATTKRTRDRLGKLLRDYPGITWADWPRHWTLMQPRKTSEIRTRRKARDDSEKNSG